MLVAEQALGGQQRRVLGQVLAVHDQVLPVHVDLHVVDGPARAACASTYRHMPMLRIRIFIAGSEFLCSRSSLMPCRAHSLGGLAQALDQPAPGVGVGGLERVVVALAARPDDQVRAERAGERGRVAQRSGAPRARSARIGVDQPAAAEARIEVQAAGDAVDVVTAERGAHVVEVVLGELVGIVELVAVDQVAEPGHGAVRPSRPPARSCSRARADSRPGRSA